VLDSDARCYDKHDDYYQLPSEWLSEDERGTMMITMRTEEDEAFISLSNSFVMMPDAGWSLWSSHLLSIAVEVEHIIMTYTL
jgi:hypothetical protein